MNESITLLCKAIKDQSDAMRMLIETVASLQQRVAMLEGLHDYGEPAKGNLPTHAAYLEHIMKGCTQPECTWCND